MIKFQIGEVFEGRNNKTGEVIFYDNLSGNAVIECHSKNNNDHYTIEIHGLKQIERDSRNSFIKITHSLSDGSTHELRLVLDYAHKYRNQRELHINLINDAKKILEKCDICSMYFKELNHKEIFTINNTIDADFIWEQVKKYMGKNLFKNYSCCKK